MQNSSIIWGLFIFFSVIIVTCKYYLHLLYGFEHCMLVLPGNIYIYISDTCKNTAYTQSHWRKCSISGYYRADNFNHSENVALPCTSKAASKLSSSILEPVLLHVVMVNYVPDTNWRERQANGLFSKASVIYQNRDEPRAGMNFLIGSNLWALPFIICSFLRLL